MSQEAKTNKTPKTVLRWKLKTLPTVDEIQSLLKDGVVTKEEARAILFSESDQDENVKALEEQIIFLKVIIDRLSSRQNINTVVQYVRDYTPRTLWVGTRWSNPVTLCSNLLDTTTPGITFRQ